MPTKRLLLSALLAALLVFVVPAGVGQGEHLCPTTSQNPAGAEVAAGSWTAYACHMDGHNLGGGGSDETEWLPGRCPEKYEKHKSEYPDLTEPRYCELAEHVVAETDTEGPNYCIRIDDYGYASELFWDPVRESFLVVPSNWIENMFRPIAGRQYFEDECSTSTTS
ncbi:MAG: hypothetical protein MSC31_09820 [Solirubrobacteraceae bacterium MAG38_C4-C5]|nr:hypothetical protein [Candidatus Siliceabacter maunaloa]